MRPTRAAWFFAAGLAWLVLRGILVQAVPMLRTEEVARHGGILLLLPLLSVAASLAAPVFFISFLRHHDFSERRALKMATVVAALASLISFALVTMSFVAAARGISPADLPVVHLLPWLFQAIPLLFVGSLCLFLAVFSRRSGCAKGLCSTAAVAAVAMLIPTIMIAAWVVQVRYGEFLQWYPDFSRSLTAKGLGIVAAAALLWFLETFATTYGDDDCSAAQIESQVNDTR